MISRAFKLRFRRRLRMRKLQVEELSQQAERQLERNFFRRLERLTNVRRFVISWILLILLLGGCVTAQLATLHEYYQREAPAPGGIYTEGILGAYTNASPLYATSPVDLAVSRLVFSGLLTYDDQNNLVGDLATSWSVDATGKVYTVHLRPHVLWQDGVPFTAADVVFTYQLIQNPDAQSPLAPSWTGVSVKEVNPLTVTFTLPDPLSSFPYSLTNGIVPKHILQGEPMTSLRTLPFDTEDPIGTGPFELKTLEVTDSSSPTDREEHIGLVPYAQYYGGEPKLDSFIVQSFRSQSLMVQSFEKNQLTAMVGLTTVPSALKSNTNLMAYEFPLTAETMTFFKTSEGVLSDTQVRQALVSATDKSAVVQGLGYPAMTINEPLLQGELGYNPVYAQSGYDPANAVKLLQADGWLPGKNGIRYKNGQPLTFGLYAESGTEYAGVAETLKQQWRKVGVNVNVVLEDATDFQTTLATHTYDALLYGISIGKDPDVIVYWGSQYADVRSNERLNFSEYSSAVADESLEEGRTRFDPTLRAIKYEGFLSAWQADAPAVALYQPRFLYITDGPVYGLTDHQINSETDRFANVQNWMIREEGVSQVQ